MFAPVRRSAKITLRGLPCGFHTHITRRDEGDKGLTRDKLPAKGALPRIVPFMHYRQLARVVARVLMLFSTRGGIEISDSTR